MKYSDLRNVVKPDAYGGVFKDRTEELLALLQSLLGTLAFRDVFRQGDQVLWPAYSVPKQLKPPIASTMRPSRRMKRFSYSSASRLPSMISAYRFALKCVHRDEQFRPIAPGPLSSSSRVAQHLLHSTVGEMCLRRRSQIC